MFRFEYNQNSGNNWDEKIDPTLDLPYDWEHSLSWYHGQIARTTAQHIFSRSKVAFWEHENEIRANEVAFYSEEVILERMIDRRGRNLFECYNNIHATLRIPQEFPNPVNFIPYEPMQNLLERFEQDLFHVNIAAAIVGNDNFNIRLALPFTRHPRFIGTITQGPVEQQYFYDQAWERYKEARENLMWRLDRVRFGEIIVPDEPEMYREII